MKQVPLAIVIPFHIPVSLRMSKQVRAGSHSTPGISGLPEASAVGPNFGSHKRRKTSADRIGHNHVARRSPFPLLFSGPPPNSRLRGSARHLLLQYPPSHPTKSRQWSEPEFPSRTDGGLSARVPSAACRRNGAMRVCRVITAPGGEGGARVCTSGSRLSADSRRRVLTTFAWVLPRLGRLLAHIRPETRKGIQRLARSICILGCSGMVQLGREVHIHPPRAVSFWPMADFGNVNSLHWQVRGPLVPAIPPRYAEAICRPVRLHREPDPPHDARRERRGGGSE